LIKPTFFLLKVRKIINPAPVSAGVFTVDTPGKVRLVIKPHQASQTAAKFAVTEETGDSGFSPPRINAGGH